MNVPCPMCLENPASPPHRCPNISLANLSEQCECCHECSLACESEFDPEAHEQEVIDYYDQ